MTKSSITLWIADALGLDSSAGETMTLDLPSLGSIDASMMYPVEAIQFGIISRLAVAAPVCDFIGTPLSGSAPLNVTFNDLSTNSPTSWLWDFGDGATSTSKNPVHSYAEPGEYNVTLIATNDAGSDTETKTSYISAVLNPASLFAGYDGLLFNAGDSSLLFQNNNGTGAVSLNSPVGYITDLSGNGNHQLASGVDRGTYIGDVSALGSELAPALGASWTAGAGWTNLGVATAATGTLSASVSLSAGKVYRLQYTLAFTSGNLRSGFTGGTSHNGPYRQQSRTYTEFLRFETGNNTLTFTPGTFTGALSAISLKEVTAWKAPYGVYMNGGNQKYIESGTTELIMPVSMMACARKFDDVNINNTLSLGENTVYHASLKNVVPSMRSANYLRELTLGQVLSADAIGDAPINAVVLNDGKSVVGTTDYRSNFNPMATTANSWLVGTSRATAKLKIANEDDSSSLQQIIYSGMIIKRDLNIAQRNQTLGWMQSKTGLKLLVPVGDSTTAAYPSPNVFQPTASLIAGVIPNQMCVAGDTCAGQKTKWQNRVMNTPDAVIIQCGVNDIDPAQSTASVIAKIQDLANTILADANCPVFIATLTPWKAKMIAQFGGPNGAIAYTQWQDVNMAISGGGATPITGAFAGRITSHTASLDDGSGNLAGAYSIGDGIHINDAGRQINADAWRAALVAAGILT